MTGKSSLKAVRVDITQEDIDAGKRNSSTDCAAVIAIKRALQAINPTLVRIKTLTAVSYASELVDDGETVGITKAIKTWVHTDTLSRWISEFDRGEKVKPIVSIIRMT